MREIKFRAWNKETKQMISWNSMLELRNLHKLLTLNFVEVMQYTGLKDKNGKEIYELSEIDGMYRVVWLFNRYVLESIANRDIFIEINEHVKYEITGEYCPIQED